MATDVIALSRLAFEKIGRGDIDGFLEQVDPEVEFNSLIAEVEAATYHGHEGVREWYAMVQESVGGLRFDVEEILEGDVPNLALVRMNVVGQASGVEIAQVMWQAIYAPEEKAVWWGIYRTEQEAREAGTAAAASRGGAD